MIKKSELKTLLRMFKNVHKKDVEKMNKKELNKLYNDFLPNMCKCVLRSKGTKGNILRGGALLSSMEKTKKGGSFFSKIRNWFNRIKEKIFFPEEKLPVKAKQIFDKYSKSVIDRFEVRRTPIESGVRTFLNAVSLGSLDRKLKELGYDNIFHLSLVVIFKNGNAITVEKNERIEITEGYKYGETEGLQLIHLPMVPEDRILTFEELLENTRKRIGDFDFFTYSAENRNCQKFIKDILDSNGLSNRYSNEFILQDAKEIFKSLPSFMGKFSQFVTDTFGRVKQFLGFGLVNEFYPYLKDIGYSVSYDKANNNYKFRYKGKSKGTSQKMENTPQNKNLACLQLMDKEGIQF
jgi:hypothetical protein